MVSDQFLDSMIHRNAYLERMCREYPHKHPYGVVAPTWREYLMVTNWCEAMFGPESLYESQDGQWCCTATGRWMIWGMEFHFKDENDLILFKMRWG